jgi:hypothetical protein
MNRVQKRACWLADADILQSKLNRIAGLLAQKCSEEQARVPAGNSNGGQWTSGSDGSPSGDQLASGFDKEDMGKTVQQFVSEKCQGKIHSVLPGEFLDKTIADVAKSAKSGNAAGNRCWKLLSEGRFRK